LSDKPLHDGPVERAAAVRRAHDVLVAAIEDMKRSLQLGQDTLTILDTIKQAMHVVVPPHGFTVLQALCERERQNAFNQTAADQFPTIRQDFEHAIQDFMIAREGPVSARRVHKVARNAWKIDPAADRRILEQQSPDRLRSHYRGQPELYDRGVVLAFESAIARAAGRSRISWTRGTKDNMSRGVMLEVFIAAVQWAMCVAWQCSAPPGRMPPTTKAEGLLRIVKAKRALTNPTN
jgi:hypothetical protein